MITIEFSIWLASKSRWAHLTKMIGMPVVPRVGEFVKFSNAKKIFYDALRRGLTPHKLSMTCAMGVVIGIFPVFGTTTILCFGIAIAFRLNIPLIQLVNYLVAPLQLIFILPFIKMGTILFRLNPFPYNMDQLVQLSPCLIIM